MSNKDLQPAVAVADILMKESSPKPEKNEGMEKNEIQIFDEPEPECFKCQSKKSDFWLKLDEGVVCNACQLAEVMQEAEQGSSSCKAGAQESGSGTLGGSRMPLRKSTRNTRNTRSKQNPYAYPRPVPHKGKGRRSMFKKTVSFYQLFWDITVII